jgi:hypothetical protein
MIDEKFVRLRTHRNNINRYRRLLRTELSELERQFIERRLTEEKSEMESLARTQVGKAPRQHFVKTVRDELAKFERNEIEFQKMERDQRAAGLGLPISKRYPRLSTSAI